MIPDCPVFSNRVSGPSPSSHNLINLHFWSVPKNLQSLLLITNKIKVKKFKQNLQTYFTPLKNVTYGEGRGWPNNSLPLLLLPNIPPQLLSAIKLDIHMLLRHPPPICRSPGCTLKTNTLGCIPLRQYITHTALTFWLRGSLRQGGAAPLTESGFLTEDDPST